MASNLVFDFRHHYVVGERRASEPSAYQFDQGHLAEIYVPENATSWEIHYAFGDFPLSEGYNVDDVEAADDGGYVITAHVPNDLFERCGELRVYIMAVEEESIITTYEGYVFIKNRNQPDDYVDDDPDNHATHLLEEAEAAAATAVEKAAETEAIATLSESYAKGGTGTRTGEDTDNAKYYMERAATLSNADLVYAVYPTSTAQGNPATFDDGAESIPVKDIRVSIVPNQDLHGYDHPWPAGGGKNMWQMTIEGLKAANTYGTWSGNAYTHNGITFTVNTDADSNVTSIVVNGTCVTSNARLHSPSITLESGQAYTLSGCPSGYGGTNLALYLSGASASIGVNPATNNGENATFTPVTTGSASPAINVNTGITISNAIVYPQLEKGNSGTSFVPYSNKCPITGTTDVEVVRTGKNLIPMTVDSIKAANTGTWSGQSIVKQGITYTLETDASGRVVCIDANGTSTGFAELNLVGNNVSFLPTGNFILSGGVTNDIRIFYFNGTSYYNANPNPVQFSIDGTETGSRCVITVANGTTATHAKFYPMIRRASVSDATFAPYSKQTVTTDLGRTVYGGTLDVTTGVLTVDRVSEVFDENTSWGTPSAVVGDSALFAQQVLTSDSVSHAESTVFQGTSNYLSASSGDLIYAGTFGVSCNARWLGIRIPHIDTREKLVAFMAQNPLQVVYPLATPLTYQLTPQEVLSVLGTNHISTDAESVDVVYRADIALYIENLTKPGDDDMVANNAITSGKFFMVNNRLFLSTASIANGATITPGTNATELSLSEALNTLNS